MSNEPILPATQPRWRPWLAAALIFIFGFAAGGLTLVLIGVRVIRQNAARPPVANAAQPMLDRAIERIARDLESELQLTPEQAIRVRAELNATGANVKQLRVRVNREVNKEFREAVVRVGRVLPPEKRKQYRELVRDRFRRVGIEAGEDPTEKAPPTEPAPESKP